MYNLTSYCDTIVHWSYSRAMFHLVQRLPAYSLLLLCHLRGANDSCCVTHVLHHVSPGANLGYHPRALWWPLQIAAQPQ